MSTARLDGRTIYHLHALGAAGVAPVNPDPAAAAPCDRGLERLRPWLDHVAALGAGAVLLTPIFVSSTHGYDTVDPFRIDQRLGDDADFDRFVATCQQRDLLLLLDGVFNHVGRAFPPFADVCRSGPGSTAARWFHVDAGRDDGDGFGYAAFEGHRELPALDHDEPEVRHWARRVVEHWSGRGVDGWRLDAAYAIPRPFLTALVADLRRDRPDLFLFGEIIHGDYAAFVTETGLDSATQYELHKAIWSSLNDANLFELAWALDRHRSMVDVFAPVTFVGNHDVTRIASRLDRTDHLAAALAIVFGGPGIPCTYYGDELGWTGVKEERPGGDDAIRPPLPPQPPVEAHPGTWAAHAELIATRRARPWLTRGRLEVHDLANHHITVDVRARRGTGALRTTIDLDDPRPPPAAGWSQVFAGPHVTMSEPAAP
ncbi:MAG: alpha-amylase family glycosyl hydrolase [Acidimicrobiales bacterium]